MLSRFNDLENGIKEIAMSVVSRLLGGDVPLSSLTSFDAIRNRRVSAPLFDLYENESEFRLVVDVPGAVPSHTHLAWNEIDTLLVHVDRRQSEEPDWYRDIVLSPEADGTRARTTLRDGVLTVRIPKQRTTSSKLLPVYAS